jgi:hypothetical protein
MTDTCVSIFAWQLCASNRQVAASSSGSGTNGWLGYFYAGVVNGVELLLAFRGQTAYAAAAVVFLADIHMFKGEFAFGTDVVFLTA